MGGRKQLRIVLRNVGVVDPESITDSLRVGGYEALGKVLSMTPGEVVEEVIRSGLRGRGGGGFPTGLKWRFAAESSGERKYVVCNADEGDPGAFMDRAILEGDPHSIVEAMAIAGYAMGASEGRIYVRAEYPLAIRRLQKAMSEARDYGLLGNRILGTDFSFDIDLKLGAGAFVCGEETSLINSMHGERGEPRTRPPYPTSVGYRRSPTAVNNVETFANIPEIILRGAEWYRKIGTEKSSGTKVFALAGKIRNVGLVEVPMGTTLREMIYDIGGGIEGGKSFKAIQTGGPSGGFLGIEHLDTPIDYDSLREKGSMMGSGGMVVMDEDDCMVAVSKFYMDFAVEESCGKCTPCRIGTKRMQEILGAIVEGNGDPGDLETLRVLCEVVRETSLCGLGQSAPNPIISTLDNFLNEYAAHIIEGSCPAGQCKSLLRYYILEGKCVGCTACARVCPTGAITGKPRELHELDQGKCIKCGACKNVCRFNAVEVR